MSKAEVTIMQGVCNNMYHYLEGDGIHQEGLKQIAIRRTLQCGMLVTVIHDTPLCPSCTYQG